MSIYKLVPNNPADPNWHASTYCGPVIVRAKDEGSAITLASHAFTIATVKKPGQPVLYNPWAEHMVTCTKIFDSGYLAEGDEEILEPRT